MANAREASNSTCCECRTCVDSFTEHHKHALHVPVDEACITVPVHKCQRSQNPPNKVVGFCFTVVAFLMRKHSLCPRKDTTKSKPSGVWIQNLIVSGCYYREEIARLKMHNPLMTHKEAFGIAADQVCAFAEQNLGSYATCHAHPGFIKLVNHQTVCLGSRHEAWFILVAISVYITWAITAQPVHEPGSSDLAYLMLLEGTSCVLIQYAESSSDLVHVKPAASV